MWTAAMMAVTNRAKMTVKMTGHFVKEELYL